MIGSSPSLATDSKRSFQRSNFDVVAIGASAGGFKPLVGILTSLPADFPAAILLVQHISPMYPTQLPNLLKRHGRLEAKLAEDGELLRPGNIYMAPPGRHLVAKADGLINLSDSAKVWFTRPAIDPLFLSLAIAYSDRALAVLLSGAGQDGAMGIRAIKGMGGVTIVQSPGTCEHRNMPKGAMETGCVDFALPPEKIVSALIALVMRKGSPIWFRSPATIG